MIKMAKKVISKKDNKIKEKDSRIQG